MATPDRSRTTSYQSTIVGIYQPCTILEICDIEEYSDLEIYRPGLAYLLVVDIMGLYSFTSTQPALEISTVIVVWFG